MVIFNLTVISGIAIGCLSLSLFWLFQSALESGSQRYKSTFEQQTNAGLRDLFVFVDPSAIWMPLFILSICFAFIVYLLLNSITLGIIFFIIVLLMPAYVIHHAKKSRLRAFDLQLPDACMRIASSLKSGMSLLEAIKALVCTSSNPIAQELSLILRENRLGITFEQSLQNLQQRMSSENCLMVTSALILSIRSGGAVANLLDQAGHTITMRLQLARKLKMMTSQGRMQAWCIGLLPLIILATLSKIDPDNTGNMLNDDLGRIYLLILVALELSGCILLKATLNQKISHPD